MPSAAQALNTQGTNQGGERPIRVMIVDDALVVRGLVSRWLQEEAGIEVVATHRSGRKALEDLERAAPDVVLLDIEMPDMDGVTALPLLMAKRPDLVVIVCSGLTRRNAEISFKCLSLGAMECVAKPSSGDEINNAEGFRRDLVQRIRTLGNPVHSRRIRSRATPPATPAAPAVHSAPPPALRPAAATRPKAPGVQLRNFSMTLPKAVLIGSSTGGPQALATVLGGMKSAIRRVPVLITQHMPPSFTTILAEHLGKVAGSPCHEPVDGEPVRAGTIYVAPGGRHMRVVQGEAGPVIAIGDDAPVNFCKPAVDPLFQSAVKVWGQSLLAIVLTGMGADGAKGAVDIANAGGTVIGQDEETSVVWGMPGASAQAGACAAVMPLNDIAPRVMRLVCGERP